ncbi:hypothetical protein LINPERPRIM_LOCUS33748, partial [Linum perenne]
PFSDFLRRPPLQLLFLDSQKSGAPPPPSVPSPSLFVSIQRRQPSPRSSSISVPSTNCRLPFFPSLPLFFFCRTGHTQPAWASAQLLLLPLLTPPAPAGPRAQLPSFAAAANSRPSLFPTSISTFGHGLDQLVRPIDLAHRFRTRTKQLTQNIIYSANQNKLLHKFMN